MEIKVTLLFGGRIPRVEKNALVEHGVQKNWISQQLVQKYHIKIQKLSRDIASESWNERQLQTLGLITLAWRRREPEIQTPMVFESQFHVSADDSIPILIGHELLSEQLKIENPSDGMLVNVLGQKSKSTSFPYRYFNFARFRLTKLFLEQSSKLKMQIGGGNKKSEFARLKLWRKRKLARGSTKYKAINMSSQALPHRQVARKLARRRVKYRSIKNSSQALPHRQLAVGTKLNLLRSKSYSKHEIRVW